MTHISETRLRRKPQTSDGYALVQTVQLFQASKNINELETTDENISLFRNFRRSLKQSHVLVILATDSTSLAGQHQEPRAHSMSSMTSLGY